MSESDLARASLPPTHVKPTNEPIQRDSIADLARPLDPPNVTIATTRWGAAVFLVLILALIVFGFAALWLGTPAVPSPPVVPPIYTTESLQNYEKAVAIYQSLVKDRAAFVKDVLLVIVPALTGLAGYWVGRQKSKD